LSYGAIHADGNYTRTETRVNNLGKRTQYKGQERKPRRQRGTEKKKENTRCFGSYHSPTSGGGFPWQDLVTPIPHLAPVPCIIEHVIELNIPGRGVLRVQHLVTDVNGTLAMDGQLIEGIAKKIGLLNDRFTIHLLTADTHGRQAVIDQQLNLTAVRIQAGNEAEQKAEYVRSLGAETVVAIGQGANDAAMLREAALGICVMSQEGAATETLLSADLVMPSITSALEVLDKPLRIVASLRK
jgi:soluble P-type ATPase